MMCLLETPFVTNKSFSGLLTIYMVKVFLFFQIFAQI